MKPPARKIVCATDFSENARAAADVAAAIALRLDATLLLVHVADEPHAYTEGTKAFRTYLRPIAAQLEKEAQRLRWTKATVEEVLLHGKWAEVAVLEFVEKEEPVLVVVSSVSKTAFDRWTIGSVSERISQRSVAPTLVVRSGQRLLAWAAQDKELKVMVAADFTINSDAALAWTRELRKIGPCAVTVAHINWPPDEHRPVSATGAATAGKKLPSVRRQLTRDLQRKAEEVLDGSVEIEVQPNWGRPDAALVHAANEMDADLIVMGTHQWHGMQRLAHISISRGVLHHAPMSVACVPVSLAIAHGAGHRPHIRRVLVATDFSAAGDHSIPWAYATLSGGGVVKLVHILAPKNQTPAATRRRVAEARDRLAALAPADAAAKRIETEVEVLVGDDPARAIGEAARSFGPDIICLGSRGHARIAESLVGSVTRAVMEQSREPVLVVRPPPS